MKLRKREPLKRGFMRNGVFAWPQNTFKCKTCEQEFQSDAGRADRCPVCRRAHKLAYFREYRKKKGKG